jgi:hypothetical protein
MNSDNTLSLTNQEVKELNDRHIGGVDKWLRMFMGLASEITKVEDNVIHLQVVYSNTVKQSKAEIVACTWLKSPKNAFLRKADTIVVTEYTDRGKPGDVVIFKEGMTREEAEEALNTQETERFGDTKWFINRHTFVTDSLLSDKNPNTNL